jgi:hypothetical protein
MKNLKALIQALTERIKAMKQIPPKKVEGPSSEVIE